MGSPEGIGVRLVPDHDVPDLAVPQQDVPDVPAVVLALLAACWARRPPARRRRGRSGRRGGRRRPSAGARDGCARSAFRRPGRHLSVTRIPSSPRVRTAGRIGFGCVLHLIWSSCTPTSRPASARALIGATSTSATSEIQTAAAPLTVRDRRSDETSVTRPEGSVRSSPTGVAAARSRRLVRGRPRSGLPSLGSAGGRAGGHGKTNGRPGAKDTPPAAEGRLARGRPHAWARAWSGRCRHITGGGFARWAGSTPSTPTSSGSRAARRSSPATGNRVEVLVDGSTYLPAVAEAIAGARSHVHLLGWCFSPELNLTREEEPVVLRNLLSDVARRVDVRLLVWEGAPFPVFRPTKRDVQSYMKVFTRGTNIQAETDSCVRLKYSHHEKIVVVDDEVAFVGGIDLTLDGGDPFDTPKHPSRGHDRLARRGDADRGPRGRRRREPLPASLARPGRGAAARARAAGAEGGRRAAGRADDPRGRLRRAAEGRLQRVRVVPARAPERGALRLPREPVPVVAGDRRDPRRQAPRPAVRRVPRRRRPSGPPERRRRRLTRARSRR